MLLRGFHFFCEYHTNQILRTWIVGDPTPIYDDAQEVILLGRLKPDRLSWNEPFCQIWVQTFEVNTLNVSRTDQTSHASL